MKLNIIQNPSKEDSEFFENKIEEFNVARWDVKEKIPLAITITNETGEILGGVYSKTFGLWLLIENLWVSDNQRGKDLGSKILLNLEMAALDRGCQYALLDTLDFQAKPFYEKHGYKVEWVQINYPKSGAKFL